jgi:hypothetical protein
VVDAPLGMVEAFRGAVRRGDWKLVKLALLPGKTELFDLAKDPGEKTDLSEQFPDIVRDLEARLLAYAKEMKPNGSRRSPPSSARKARPCSTWILTAACRGRGRGCRGEARAVTMGCGAAARKATGRPPTRALRPKGRAKTAIHA